MLDQITGQLDQMSSRFNFKPDPEVEALKVSPEPQEVLQVMEETVKEDAEVREAVEDITDEVEAVHKEVKRTSGKLDEVAEDVEEIKQEVKARTGEQERLSLV
jgi:peptidoglycan hydrolase CwlO-like protein